MEILNNLKDDTATEHDNLTVKLLEHIVLLKIEPLIYIYNKSITAELGIIDALFKIIKLILMHSTLTKKNITVFYKIVING